MASNAGNPNPTNKFKKGNKAGGAPKGLMKDINLYKKSLFKLYKEDEEKFKEACRQKPIEALRIMASLCPRELVDTDGVKIIFQINDKGVKE